VRPDGSSTLCGTAEEIVIGGHWLGNWHDALGDNVPEPVLGAVRGIVERAANLGYRGITGIDVARLGNDTWRVLDLNFRVNGSTAGAWLRASITANRGARVLRGRGWTCPGGFELLTRVVRDAIRRGTLVPLGFYDPSGAPMGGVARVAGLLVGDSRAEIEEEDRRLIREGLK
jgi:ribosome modulation factor